MVQMSEDRLATKGDTLRARATSGSPLAAYQELVVGRRGLGALLRYELAGLAAVLPGAAGLLSRRVLWRGLFQRSGRGVVWGRGITVRHPGKMSIGDGVVVDDGCYLDAKGCLPGEFRLDDAAFVSRGCVVSGKDGPVHIGARVNLGADCLLYSSGGLEIGEDTMLAGACYVGGGGYETHGSTDVVMREQPLPGKGVVIGPDCWLGARVVVVSGVRVGRGCVIGAGAVVTRDLPDHAIAVGIPARVIGFRGRGSPALASAPDAGTSPTVPEEVS
jgi:acetyltransferase-like isoleucine patch superfamily enzyme